MAKLVLILLSCLVSVAFSATCYISTVGNDTNACTMASPCQTMSNCISMYATQSSLDILLAAGLYGEENCNVIVGPSVNVTFSNVTFQGYGGPARIDCGANSTVRHFVLEGLPATQIAINNLQLSNGHGDKGGCIYASSINQLNISYSMFQNCIGNWGGALYTESNVAIANTTFQECAAENGGALYISISANGSYVDDCVITKNFALSYGGGIYMVGDYLTMINTNVTLNNANYGGGMFLTSLTPTNKKGQYYFLGSQISYNAANISGGGLYSQGLNHTWNVFGALFVDNSASLASVDSNIACDFGSKFCFACLAKDCVNHCPANEGTSCTQTATSAFCYSNAFSSCAGLNCKCKAIIPKVEKILIVIIGILMVLGISLVAIDLVRYFVNKRKQTNEYTPIK